ncbi:MAG: RIP metalloprotease RseP [Acidobacteria bacterium]|nr:RIP metalloprotease RseP [Acidobacteriota bacterium]
MLYVVITNVLAVVVVLGVMILIHELGHFLAAKYFGIRVEVFSFGFGKRLWGFQKGETDYRVSLLPLGGYVKMAGENPDEAPIGNLDEFQAKPRWQRFIVAVMGPAMNIVLAIVLLTGLFMYRYQKPAYEEGPAVIGWLEPDSPAVAAGFAIGDHIIRLENNENPSWGDIALTVAANVEKPLHVVVERGGERLLRTLTPRPEGRAQLGFVGWSPRMPAKLQAVEPDLPAAQAGLQAGDEIVAINGQPILFWPGISEMLQENAGAPLQVTYRRGPCPDTALDLSQAAPQEAAANNADRSCGELFSTQITPTQASAEGDPQQRWRIGVMFQNEMITRQLSLADAFSESLATNKKFALLIFEFVGKIFTRDLSPRTLEGPIGIARLSGAAARQSFGDLVSLMAAISLNLGIFNLFPIPVLDGGLILLLLIEGAIRRDLPRRAKERITQVGFAFLMLIAVFVIYNDIVKSLPERFERFFP